MPQLQTKQSDIAEARVVNEGTSPSDFELSQGEVLLQIEKYAFTANNITYGVIGHRIGYWKFFPVDQAAADDGWGLVPVWGFAKVAASKHAEVAEGERVYGYFPMSSFLRVQPAKISDDAFFDGASHRAELPPVYNRYQRVNSESANGFSDDVRPILDPLYITSFCLCDALEDQSYHGADQVVILSASSKTAIGLAYGLSQISGAKPEIVGLTSDTNEEFVQSLGIYDTVITYQDLSSLKQSPAVLVDMSGNRSLLGRVHSALGDNMKYCHAVGLTHWDDMQGGEGAEGFNAERTAMFFAPGHIQKRMAEWGGERWNGKVQDFLQGAREHAQKWMTITHLDGLSAFEPVYHSMVAGNIAPKEGVIVRL